VEFSKDGVNQVFPQYVDLIPPAFTVGGVIPSFFDSLLGNKYVNRPIGAIAMRRDIQEAFTSTERRFIVAHEYSHIMMNHWPMALLGPVLGDIAGSVISGMKDDTVKSALQVILPLAKVLASIRFTRQSEIDSDLHAMKLVGSKSTAESTIRKLARIIDDDNLDVPTHYVFVDGAAVGVLTYRDRLNQISNAK
jgi:Zn-dependent protease with chaperone function